MSLVSAIHGGLVHRHRVLRLSRHLKELIPKDARVLDVGCGDGLLSQCIARARPDTSVEGIDVRARAGAHISIREFDGRSIPFADRSHHIVMLVDVLHHASDPKALLAEAVRVCRTAILIKDHLLEGAFARPTLRFMDVVGNARHGVALPYCYWSRKRWQEAFEELGLTVDVWIPKLGIYPWPASWVFERSLHFMARLLPPPVVVRGERG